MRWFFFARGFVCILNVFMFLCFRFFWGVLFFSKVFVLFEKFFFKKNFKFFSNFCFFRKKEKRSLVFFQRGMVCFNVK